jgi:ketose-bisphosphate aldolase
MPNAIWHTLARSPNSGYGKHAYSKGDHMSQVERPANLLTLREALPIAERGGYALGSFSPRYAAMIQPVLWAAERARSPLIVQISSNEFRRYEITPDEFAAEFFAQFRALQISVPVVLHLDHTKDMTTIVAAIDAGFTSVMIDASELPLAENISRSREVAAYALERGVSVEAELGRIGTTDRIETDDDVELYTDPDEAATFVAATGVDALAVSVGTAHGVYLVRQPKIDIARLEAIRARTTAHLVLHGGSGVPASMVEQAIRLSGGGVSKVNIATDLEQAALAALGRDGRMVNAEMNALPDELRARTREAVAACVSDKITNYLGSAGQADAAAWAPKSA